jgi:hypothetical protein
MKEPPEESDALAESGAIATKRDRLSFCGTLLKVEYWRSLYLCKRDYERSFCSC